VGDSWRGNPGLLVCFKMFDPDGYGFSNQRTDTAIDKNKQNNTGTIVKGEVRDRG
jgi:hypothetical protein